MTGENSGKFNLIIDLDFYGYEHESGWAGLCSQIPMLVVGATEQEAKNQVGELLEFSKRVLQTWNATHLSQYLIDRNVPFKLEVDFRGEGRRGASFNEFQLHGQERRQMELSLAG